MAVQRSLRSRLPLALIVLVGGGAVVAAPAGAYDEPDTLDCRGSSDRVITPGMGTSAAAAKFAPSVAGVLKCEGVLNGKKAIGPAEYAAAGTFAAESTCVTGKGEGLLRLAVATESGPEQIDAPFTFTYPDLPSYGGATGGKIKFANDDYWGNFDFTPTKGDCVTEPITVLKVIDDLSFDS